MSKTEPTEMSWDELLESRTKLLAIRENEIDSAISVINDEIKDRLTAEKINGKIVGRFQVQRIKKYLVKTSLAVAKNLGLTKEVPDTEKIKNAFLKGAQIEGVSITEYIMVREKE